MVVVLLLHHLGDLLELFVIAGWQIGPDACVGRNIPNRLSSISGFFAMYLALRDLLLIDYDVFCILTDVHSYDSKI